MLAVDLNIVLDSEKVQVLDVRVTSLLSGFFAIHNVVEDTLKLAAASAQADRYPLIQAFLADQGYRGTTVTFLHDWLNRRVDIVEKTNHGFQVQPQRWIVERTLGLAGQLATIGQGL